MTGDKFWEVLNTTQVVTLFVIVWIIVIYSMNVFHTTLRYAYQHFLTFLKLFLSAVIAVLLLGFWSPPTSIFHSATVSILSVAVFCFWFVGSSITLAAYSVTRICTTSDCSSLKEGAILIVFTLFGYCLPKLGKENKNKKNVDNDDNAQGNCDKRIAQLEGKMLKDRMTLKDEIRELRTQTQLLERLLKLEGPK
ncbi:hypothetical protein F5X99DRAFT_405729 [Biscogniauxia marginata]|nr:hypothetical protein F5X99DRAFT_405729 [Biscogniauxia marginata]